MYTLGKGISPLFPFSFIITIVSYFDINLWHATMVDRVNERASELSNGQITLHDFIICPDS